ncbi:YibE/F family protein [uncultured Clostridium sp.]|uniref:YibE/F family protein n=1 Tax=uncultured Clostridium sp. TaxID=59620 RepID=UPI0025CC97A1|nr:YibE/F family protein [uncultured Clostridium sp.]
MINIKDKNIKLKILILIICGIIFCGLFYFANNKDGGVLRGDTSSTQYVKAKVLSLLENNLEAGGNLEGVQVGNQKIEIEIKSGVHKGERTTITNQVGILSNVIVSEGSNIVVRINNKSNGSYDFSVYNYDRSGVLYGFIILFCLALCAIGGKKGAKAMLGLIFTMVSVFFILLPLIMKGYDSPVITMIIVALTTVVCLIILDGVNSKTISAILGTIIGVAFAGTMALIVGKIIKVSGFNTNEAEYLVTIAGDNGLKIRGLLVSTILISSLGAIMDVAMSIASSVNEVYHVNKKLGSKELFISGMNIGKDAMGTMANTLILAFTGSSLNLLILIYSYGISFSQLINTDLIAIEILQGISGSLGIIFTVPIVAFISSKVVFKYKF